MDKEIEDKLTAFKFALEGDIRKAYGNVQVKLFNIQDRQNKVEFVVGVDVRTSNLHQQFEIWKARGRDQVYWDYYTEGGLNVFV